MNQGVYVITHIKSDKKYVGSSVTLKRRLNRHKNELRKGIHRNQPLQRAWAKYGEEAFVFEVVERVQDDSTLLCREQHWMDALRKTHKLYNTCPKAGSPLGMKLTEEQRAKISAAHKGRKKSAEHCAALAVAQKNRIRTEDEINAWAHNRLGKSNSQEHIEKAKQARKDNWVPGRYAGSKNPSARRCSYKGVEYACVKDAVASSTFSRPTVTKHVSFRYL